MIPNAAARSGINFFVVASANLISIVVGSAPFTRISYAISPVILPKLSYEIESVAIPQPSQIPSSPVTIGIFFADAILSLIPVFEAAVLSVGM